MKEMRLKAMQRKDKNEREEERQVKREGKNIRGRKEDEWKGRVT